MLLGTLSASLEIRLDQFRKGLQRGGEGVIAMILGQMHLFKRKMLDQG